MFRVLREYERGVIFMLGRFYKIKGPGLIIIIPVLQQMVKVDLRTIVMDVPTQDVISKDNVSVKVNAVVYFRVIDPIKAIVEVETDAGLVGLGGGARAPVDRIHSEVRQAADVGPGLLAANAVDAASREVRHVGVRCVRVAGRR